MNKTSQFDIVLQVTSQPENNEKENRYQELYETSFLRSFGRRVAKTAMLSCHCRKGSSGLSRQLSKSCTTWKRILSLNNKMKEHQATATRTSSPDCTNQPQTKVIEIIHYCLLHQYYVHSPQESFVQNSSSQHISGEPFQKLQLEALRQESTHEMVLLSSQQMDHQDQALLWDHLPATENEKKKNVLSLITNMGTS